jgi:uncharacterized delta-60 repeat protein
MSGTVVSQVMSNFSAAALQSDGGILVAGQGTQSAIGGQNGPLQLLRFLPNGSIDTPFGNDGSVVFPPPNGQSGQFFHARSVVLEPDGKPVVSGDSSFATVCSPDGGSVVALLRFNLDGSIDSSYGNGGAACTSLNGGGIAAAQPNGAVVVTGYRCVPSCVSELDASRYDSSGMIDPTFGSNGTAAISVTPPLQFPSFNNSYFVDAIVVQPDGRLLLGLSGPPGQAIVVATRLNPDGSVDHQFAGGNGAFSAIGDVLPSSAHTPSPAGGPTFIGVQSDGKVVLVSRPWDAKSGQLHFGVARFSADGTLDTGYGTTGVVIGPTEDAQTPGSLLAASVLVQPDDKLVIAGEQHYGDFVLARFLASPSTDLGLATSANPSPPGQSLTLTASVGVSAAGTIQFSDGAFAIPGCAAVPLVAAGGNTVSNCSTVSLAPGAHVIAATYSGDAANPAGQSPLLVEVIDATGTDVVVEYEYPDWNHFFITSLPNEIAALDSGAIPGWQRTGETFAVYPTGAPLSATQCRFFSGAAFAPKSSHFYSPYPFECRIVSHSESDVWVFEGNVSPVRLPDASGACPVGARPLYRLYNNGMGGAPNHRYTTSLAILSSMLGQGWVYEGDANTKVFACVP